MDVRDVPTTQGRRLEHALEGTLGAALLGSLAMVALSGVLLVTFRRYADSFPDGFAAVDRVEETWGWAGTLWLGVALAAAVLMAGWSVRIAEASSRVGRPPATQGRVLAAMWFLPIVDLIVPYQVLKVAAGALDDLSAREAGAPTTRAAQRRVRRWIITFVAAALFAPVGYLSTGLYDTATFDPHGGFVASVVLTAIAFGVLAVAGAETILMVGQLSALRQRAAVEAPLPSPPPCSAAPPERQPAVAVLGASCPTSGDDRRLVRPATSVEHVRHRLLVWGIGAAGVTAIFALLLINESPIVVLISVGSWLLVPLWFLVQALRYRDNLAAARTRDARRPVQEVVCRSRPALDHVAQALAVGPDCLARRSLLGRWRWVWLDRLDAVSAIEDPESDAVSLGLHDLEGHSLWLSQSQLTLVHHEVRQAVEAAQHRDDLVVDDSVAEILGLEPDADDGTTRAGVRPW